MRDARAFYLAAILAILFIAALAVGAELSAPAKDWLKSTFGHHWVGKSILATAFFAVVLALSYYSRTFDSVIKRFDAREWSVGVALATAVSLLFILSYFVFHSFL